MKLQIIESISKHAVTLVLVIGILMLTEKGIMPTGIIAMLLLTGGIIGFLFRVLLLIVRIAFIFFIVGLLFFEPIKPTYMKTSTCISSAPVMPAVWPQSEHIRPVKRRLPNTVDEPKNIGYYLESLRDIASRPDREDVLKEFFKETYV